MIPLYCSHSFQATPLSLPTSTLHDLENWMASRTSHLAIVMDDSGKCTKWCKRSYLMRQIRSFWKRLWSCFLISKPRLSTSQEVL